MNNIVDTLTWTKGKHTITTGMNFRVMTNNKFTYSQSYPSYGFNDNVAVGLGEDIQTGPHQLHGRPKPATPISRSTIPTTMRRRSESCWAW